MARGNGKKSTVGASNEYKENQLCNDRRYILYRDRGTRTTLCMRSSSPAGRCRDQIYTLENTNAKGDQLPFTRAKNEITDLAREQYKNMTVKNSYFY